MKRVLFVCLGNICRSTMAEFVMKDMVLKAGVEEDFYIASAGTSDEEEGNDTHPGTKAKLTAEGIPFTRRRARQINRQDYQDFDYIIGMEQNNLRNMTRAFGGDPDDKCSLLLDYTSRPGNIADPWYTGNFEDTYRDIKLGCAGLLKSLQKI